MTLRYRYRLERVGQPVFPLGGRWVRPRPIIPLTVLGPAKDQPLQGKLDTGADDTIFPERIATILGVDLSAAFSGHVTGLGSGRLSVRFAQIRLRLDQPGKQHEWPAWVAFTKVPMKWPLLGFAGFLQFFTATFRGDREEVELEVNGLYPGT
jgi:hypothetical protein